MSDWDQRGRLIEENHSTILNSKTHSYFSVYFEGGYGGNGGGAGGDGGYGKGHDG